MLAEQWLMIAGCSIFAFLGALHACLTLASHRLDPRDPQLTAHMRRAHPVLTRETTMWKTWVGFNLSHSLGAIVFGALVAVLTIENYPYLKSSPAMTALLAAVCAAYIWLAFAYWFSTPRNGILVASALIAASLALRWLG